MQMNAEQQAAIDSKAERILCLAGAGSGKTRTLVARIERMVADGADPKEITAITYTVAAATELQSRLKFRLGYVGTLHSFVLRLLARHSALVGLPSNVSVLDDEQRQEIALRIAAEMNVKISWSALEVLLDLDRYAEAQNPSHSFKREELVAVEYHRQCRRNGVLDFDDILRFGAKLAGALAEGWAETDWFWRHLFVDEYQDAADLDAVIYERLPADTKFFVADPDQAIFGFRGGNVENVLRLAGAGDVESGFAPFLVYKLETNYRCRAAICHAAQTLVERNSNRWPKETVADQPGGSVEVWRSANPAMEMTRILDHIIHTTNHVEDKPAIAVLCRTNRVADEIRDYIYGRGGIKVARRERVEVPHDWRICKLLLTLASNPWNDFVAYQYLFERHGKVFADAVKSKCAKHMLSLNEGHLHFDDSTPATMAGVLTSQGISPESRERVHDACRRLSHLGGWSIGDLVALLNSDERRQEETDGVVVTTIHAAKGREWDCVILAGFEDEAIPAKATGAALEEERRLAYVAFTRAKRWLVVSHCDARATSRGPNLPAGPLAPRTPSRFIKEAGLAC